MTDPVEAVSSRALMQHGGRDFSLPKYRELLKSGLESSYRFMTIAQYLEGEPHGPAPLIIMRHDVDRAPRMALTMARLEHALGIQSTYYFRYTPSVFQPSLISEIFELGHEIGYHYETLPVARGNYETAYRLFEQALNEFRAITEIKTVSMHGRPFSGWDSRSLWNRYDLKELQLLGEAYLSIDYTKISYYCDTGRTWDSLHHNIRDRTPHAPRYEVSTTDELMALIRMRRLGRLCISAHPNRWPQGILSWIVTAALDHAINAAKFVVKLLRTK